MTLGIGGLIRASDLLPIYRDLMAPVWVESGAKEAEKLQLSGARELITKKARSV